MGSKGRLIGLAGESEAAGAGGLGTGAGTGTSRPSRNLLREGSDGSDASDGLTRRVANWCCDNCAVSDGGSPMVDSLLA